VILVFKPLLVDSVISAAYRDKSDIRVGQP